MELHKLKIQREYFKAVMSGDKTFEIRKNDRDFPVGDIVLLEEFIEASGYTNRQAAVIIKYITDYEQKDDYIVFSFNLIK